MSVKCLNKENKSLIAEWYSRKLFNQKELAERFGVSQRTINRVLIEKHLATPGERFTEEVQAVMKVVNGYELNAQSLKKILEAPAFTHANVQAYLNQCTKDQLAQLFYMSSLVKVHEMANAELQEQTKAQKEALHAA